MQIEHINDVLPHIKDRAEFVIKRAPDYTVIDYVYVLPDSFDHPARLECRGIKFTPDGQVLARPFAKFFNIGERPETQPHLIDVSQPHVVMEKLDGSMIHPARLNGELVFMTRMGVTEIAQRALEFAKERAPNVIRFCQLCIDKNCTPIFEYTAPDNQIVIRYAEPALTLLAVRGNNHGLYAYNAPPFLIPAVKYQSPIRVMSEFVEHARSLTGAEGYVIRFDDGLMLKIKADDYVTRHRAKSEIGLEKNALRAVLEGADDDLAAVLPSEDAAALEAYAADVRSAITFNVSRVNELLVEAGNVDRKTFATQHAPKLPAMLRPAAFKGFEGRDVRPAIVELLLKQTGSATKVQAVRGVAGLPDWQNYYQEDVV